MRKMIVALFLAAAVASPVGAQQWHTANRVVLSWSAVEPLDAGDEIKYQVYIRPASGNNLISVGGEVAGTQATISFQTEGRYYLCAQTLRYPQGESAPVRSEVACSDNPAAVLNGQTFGAVYYLAPGSPGGLKLVP